MRIGGLWHWHYYWARLKAHPLQELLALVGIATGVALIFAVLVANASVTGTLGRLTSAVAGNASTQVVARDSRGVDEHLLERVRGVAGVRAAAATLEQQVDVSGPRGSRSVNFVGVTPELAALGGPLPRSLGEGGLQLAQSVVLAGPVADAIGVEPGGTAVMDVRGRAVPVRISVKLGEEQLGEYVDSPLAFAPLAYAQRVTALPGRVSRVLVVARHGGEASVRADLQRRFGERMNVGDVYTEARLLRDAARPLEQSANLFAGISALVGLLFAFNAMLLTAGERRRFIADLRMQGFGAGQVVTHMIFEALMLGIAASVVGLVLGDQLSRHLFEPLPGYLTFAFPVGVQRIVPASAILLACAAGIGASLLAGARPLRDVLLRAPIDAVHRSAGEPAGRDTLRVQAGLFIGGVALLVATAIAVHFVPELTLVGSAALLAALLLVLPFLLRPVVGLASRVADSRRGRLLMVAASEIEATPTRSVALAATAAVAVFGVVAIEGARQDLERGLDRASYGLTHTTDLWVAANQKANTLTTVPVSTRSLANRLTRAPGIRAVREYQGSFLDFGRRRLWVIGRPAADRIQIPADQVVEGNAARAAELIRGGGWVALTDAAAREHGIDVGDRFRLPTPSGGRTFRLAATLTNVGWAAGTLIVNARDYRRSWNTREPTALEVDLEPGVTPQAGERLVARALGPDAAALRIDTADSRWSLLRANARQGLSRLSQISALALISAILALAAAIGLAVWQRRPQLAELKLHGFSTGQLLTALIAQMALLLGVGAFVGAAFGLYGQALGTRWLELTTGFPAPYQPAGALALSILAVVSLVALTIATLPGWIAARVSLPVAFRAD